MVWSPYSSPVGKRTRRGLDVFGTRFGRLMNSIINIEFELLFRY